MTDDQEDPGYAPGGYPGRYPRPFRYPREGLGIVWTPERLRRLRESIEAFQERGWVAPMDTLPPGHHGNMHTEPGEWRPLGFVREEDLDVKPERGPSADLEIRDETLVPPLGSKEFQVALDAVAAQETVERLMGLPPRLPRRAESPVCECGHRRSGHSVGSVVFKDQCWNCRGCTGFRERVGE